MDAKLVRELFSYDQDTGKLTWLVDRPQRIKAGMIAGCRDRSGYCRVKYNGKSYAVHRLIFLWMMGRWPKVDVDHADMDKTNNRWYNLREATHAENRRNRIVRKDNTTGFKGVVYKPPRLATKNYFGRYEAWIKVDGKKIYLGYRRTAEEAAKLYAEAAEKYHLQFARS